MSDLAMHGYPADPVGYGSARPDPAWPGGARLALQLSVLAAPPRREGPPAPDAALEPLLPRLERQRHEGAARRRDADFGSRVGLHRLRALLRRTGLPATWFFPPDLAERLPALVRALAEEGDEIAVLGGAAELQEGAEGVAGACRRLAALAGTAPLGWRSLRRHPDGRRAIAAAGLLYDADAADDDLPYWAVAGGGGLLVLPATPLAGRGAGALARALAFARAEAVARPQMLRLELSPGLHGRPDEADVLAAALAGLACAADLWAAPAAAIARHWQARFPFAWT